MNIFKKILKGLQSDKDYHFTFGRKNAITLQ